MSYLANAQIEARAAELVREHSLEPGFDVERLLDRLDLSLLWEAVDDSVGGRVLGQLVPAKRQVILNERHVADLEDKGSRLLRYTIGHEVGHWILHAEAARSGALPLFDGERIWCRDKSRDPIERQAEMFSAALLIPRDQLKEEVPTNVWSGWRPVYRLADKFQVHVTPMRIRLEQLGWAHLDEDDNPHSGPKQRPGQDTLFA
jgi:hypothetical protein